MLNKTLSVLGGLVLSASALAQAPLDLGRAADVQGLVTMSDGKNIRSVQNDDRIFEGVRVVSRIVRNIRGIVDVNRQLHSRSGR